MSTQQEERSTTELLARENTSRIARFLEPRTIAVVGASPNEGSATRLLKRLMSHGYDGDVYFVNPKYDEVDGRKCYPTVGDIPCEIDVAALVVPARAVPEALRGCVTARVGTAVIMAAGFVEDSRGPGKALQAEIDEVLRDTDLAVCGPNSEGFFNLSSGIALSLSPSVDVEFLRQQASWLPDDEADLGRALRGGVAIVAQSGGLGFSIFSRGVAAGVGFSHVVSVGNEVDIDVLDCAEYLLTRPEVRVIGMYVEGLRHPERLAIVADAARSAGKALVMGKAGASEAGRAATLSHTGHLAGEALVNDAAFRRAGVVQVYDQEELLDVCAALATNTPVDGDRVAVVSWSGGSAVWASDALERAGFQLPELDQGRQDELAELLPPFASLRNPVDITGASKVGLTKVMRVVASAPYLDALVLITTLNSERLMERDGQDLAELVAEANKPILVYTYTEPLPAHRRVYRDLGLALYPSSLRCVRALKALRSLSVSRARSAQPEVADVPLSPPADWPVPDDRGVLTERQTTELLHAAGFPSARHLLAETEDEAAAAVAEIGGPVALKVQAASLPHKAAAGGVLLDVTGEQDVRAGFRKLIENVGAHLSDCQGVLVQEMVPPGLEMLVGIDNTSGFGPVMVLGAGGSNVERVRDVAMDCAPLTEADVLAMIGSLRCGALLEASTPGVVTYDTGALVDFLVRLSHWAVQHAAAISELDINPLIVSERGVVILDSLLVTNSSSLA